jgi:transcription termination factor Rho
MFDISVLKEMKLSELQEIAKLATTIKVNGVKKEALIQHILDHQNATQNSDSDKKEQPKTSEDKPKRVRIVPEKKASNQKKSSETLFSNVEESIPSNTSNSRRNDN